jgi:light-regulated signal transduction histidine kinase (bacteriophytochrome)
VIATYSMCQSELKIAWQDVVKFIGQLNHDIRNHLNGIELQSAFLGEIVEQPEAKSEVLRLREMTGEMSARLQRLSNSLAKIQPSTIRYQAREFVEDLRAKLTHDQPKQSTEMEWQISLGEERIEIDPPLLQEAFQELIANAFAHGRGEGAIVFAAREAGPSIEFVLREPKMKFEETTQDWGARPLAKFRQGHYALGLHRARSIFEAHHGSLQAQFDSAASVLTTTVALPRAAR